jgi:outer membrane biosynthesis protein TonB
MSIIQIPLRDPDKPLPPTPRVAEAELFDGQQWESAYRDLHATPTLLVQLQDDLSRSRMREAFWISVVVHLIIVILLYTSPTFERWMFRRGVLMVAPNSLRNKELTYIEMPPDTPKATKRPNTNIISDKDRIATSKKTHLDAEDLRKILDSGRPGAPGPVAPPAPKPESAQPPVSAQNPPSQQQQQQAQAQARQPSPPANKQTAKLQAPPNPFGGNMSTSSAIEEAARASVANRSGYGGAEGDYGLGQGRQPTQALGPVDVISDTMGVDFGPYLSRVLQDVRQNWYNLIPEAARPPIMKKGKVAIEFAILKDGSISGLQRVATSGDISLDRAAWGGITACNPFPPLPSQFGGQYLALRFYFYYNPDKNDLQ